VSTEEQITRARTARERRDRLWTLASIPLLVLYCITIGVALRSDNPLFGLAIVGYAAFTSLRPLMVDGRDSLQLHRALKAFSIAGAATLLYLVVDTIMLAARDGYATPDGGALRIFGLVWLLANLALLWGFSWRTLWVKDE
jgi:hypothetical protein